jgi:hypothetical protein
MRFKIILLLLLISMSSFAQNNLSIPGFGSIPLVQEGDLYSLNFGKLGKFEFSGTIKPLSLTATVGMDELKAFPGAKVISALGLEDIEFTVTERDFQIAGNISAKFWNDIRGQLDNIPAIGPIIDRVMKTLDVRDSRVALTFDKAKKLIGEVELNVYVLGKRVPIPKIEGEINPAAIAKTVVNKIKDIAQDELLKVAKAVAKAFTESGKVLAGAADRAFDLAKTASKYATKSKSEIDNKYVPRHARKVAGPVLYASNMAYTKFYDEVIPILKMIEGKTDQETRNLRANYVKADWDRLATSIEADWTRIRKYRKYVDFYIMPSSATNGGHIYRRHIDEEKGKYIAYRNRLWERMMSEKELIVKNKDVYFVKSVSENKWWDLPGFHYNAGRYNSQIGLYEKDNHKGRYEGADRFIKVIRTGNPDIVFLQPQHSHYVVANANKGKTPGTGLGLYHWDGNDRGQLFEMETVRRKSNTYYLKHIETGMYVTASGSSVKLQKRNKSKDQQWRFDDASSSNLMAAPDTDYRFRVENVQAKRTWDIAGAMRDTKGKGTEIKLWDQDDWPDRFIGLENHEVGDETYFYIRVLHHNYVVDIASASLNNGAKAVIWDKNNQMNQQFKFIYAGSPLTYYIQDRNSGKVLNADKNTITQNGCPVEIWDYQGADKQKWKLRAYKKWQTVNQPHQNFHVKAAYTNGEYWDFSGGESTKGEGVQNWGLDGGRDRLFKIIPTGDHAWVNIQGVQSGLMIDVPNNTDKNGTQIRLWPKNGADAQKFGLEFTGEYTFLIVTKRWKAIDIEGDPYNGKWWREDGRKVRINNHEYIQDRHWQLFYADGPKKGQLVRFPAVNPESPKAFIPKNVNAVGGGSNSGTANITKEDPFIGKTFIIQSAINYGKNAGGCWDIPGGKNPTLSNGKNIEMWQENGGKDQQFSVFEGSLDGYYELAPSYNTVYRVNVDGGKSGNGTNVEIWQNNLNRRQNFKFKHMGGGRFKIMDANGRVLCLAGRSSNNGSNIHIWEDHDGPWMEFYLLDPTTRRAYIPNKEKPYKPIGNAHDKPNVPEKKKPANPFDSKSGTNSKKKMTGGF